MIRVKISNFIKKNINKIRDLGTKVIIVAIVVFIATIMLSSFSYIDNNKNTDLNNVYKPTDTVISGSNVSDKQFTKDSNTVNNFLELCNNNKLEEAYTMLSEECKTEVYPTIEIFKKNYLDTIFYKKRDFNLQAWISTSEITIYKIRYTNNMLSTGTYDENDVFEDYITINKKNNEEKISIGNFIDTQNCNIITKNSNLQAIVTKKTICMNYEEYVINITNNTQKTILLDNLRSSKTISLIAESGTKYGANINKLYITDLLVSPNETQTITIRFGKSIAANNKSVKLQFSNIITDYNAYLENEENSDIADFTIKVED